MTNQEASDVNTVLAYFLHIPDVMGHVPEDDQAHDAAMRLIERANNKLMAGLLPRQVEQAWK